MTSKAKAIGTMGAAAKIIGRIPVKLFGLPDVDSASADELAQALDKVRAERAETVGRIATLTDERTSALLQGDDPAVTAAETALDKAHREVERYDLLAGELEVRVGETRQRELAQADRDRRQRTADRLNEMATDFEANAPRLGSALQNYRRVCEVSEQIGSIAGGVNTCNAMLGVLAQAPAIAEALRARAVKCLSGTGASTFEGLE